MHTIDLDRFFARIGYAGSRAPTLDTLRDIAWAQAITVPFENIDVLSGRGIDLDLAVLEEKIVDQRRGGYCFEQNGLALAALQQIGFDAVGLIGRVRWMVPDDHPTGATHMVIRIELPGGPYIFDAGFGGMRLTGPMKLKAGERQKTPHEDFQLVADGDGFLLQGDLGDRWTNIYRFTLDPQTKADYDVSSWYTSTHPDSLFMNTLIVELPGDGIRRMVVNNMYIERLVGQAADTRTINSLDELDGLLEQHFALPLRDDADRAAVAKFITT